MAIHASLMTARTENLLPDLLSDVERIASNTIKEAIERVPSVYLHYLTPQSLQKITRKVTSLIRELKSAMEQELKDIEMYSLRLKEQLKELYQEADLGLRDIIENDVEKIKAVFEFFGIENIKAKIEVDVAEIESSALPADIKQKISNVIIDNIKPAEKVISRVRFTESYKKS